MRPARRGGPGGKAGGLALLLLLLLPALPAAAQNRAEPEAAAGGGGQELARAGRHMVAAAHPAATEAGLAMLRQGGNALDAAIAAAMVLNLVEPQSSGIGGGGFLLHWEQAGRRLASYDGRETAPAAARPERFLDAGGRPRRFAETVPGGLSVGVPGLLRMLEAAHRGHGRLRWEVLFQPAIRLAEDGFAVGDRLAGLLAADPALQRFPAARAYFARPDGTPLRAGDRLANPALARTFRLIAAGGADALYRGPLADAIVAAVAGAPENPGDMTLEDLARYRALERPPVCGPYRLAVVCGVGPPSSGGIAVLQILTLLERFDLAGLEPVSAEAAHLFAEAGRLAYADRAQWLADPDRVEVPVAGLLYRGYLEDRSGLIDLERSMGTAPAGEPPARQGRLAPDPSLRDTGTTHLSVLDGDGNAVALTASIEGAFGSRLMVAGFLLNNQLTDFAFAPEQDGVAVANRVEPGKRPRSSMAPTLVLDARMQRVLLALGSPGGSRIPNYVAQALVAMLDWRLDPQAAAALPHYGSRNGPTELEADTAAAGLRAALESLGHRVETAAMTSGLEIVVRVPDGLLGGIDPRREGLAAGD